MSGHAFYIWGSYGVTALFMAVEVYLVVRRRRQVLKRLTRLARSGAKVKHEG